MNELKELFAQYVSEEVLTEDNLTKIEVMFESAINEAVKVKTEELDVVFEDKLRIEMESFETATNEGINDYLQLFVEEFATENKVAITNRLMVEKAQSVLSKMQEVFVENGITIPETNEALLNDISVKFEDMETKFNEATSEKIELSKTVVEMEKANIFITMTESLFDTDKEKIMNLMEGLVVESVEDFKAKLSIIVEKAKEDEDEDEKNDDKSKDEKDNKDSDEVDKKDKDDKEVKETDNGWAKNFRDMKF